MNVLNVDFWTTQTDGTYILYCTDPKLGADFQVTIPKRYNGQMDFSELKQGQLTLPKDYSIKIAS